MSGQALSFLSKKSWHTTNVRNVEKVWLQEQKKLAEEKKLIELRKQIEEEREIEQLQALQEKSGLVTRDSKSKAKLSWMYQGPQANQPTSEDYLLGNAEKKLEEDNSKVKELEQKTTPGSLWLNKSANDPNEKFQRLHEDPLFQIRQREQAARDAVLNNPIKLERAREAAKRKLRGEDRKKKKKKSKSKKKQSKKKKSKSKKHKKRSRRSDDSSSSDDDHSDYDRKKRSKTRKRKRSRSDSFDSSDSDLDKRGRRRRVEDEKKKEFPGIDPNKRYGLQLTRSNDNRSSTATMDDASLGPSTDMKQKRRGYVEDRQAKLKPKRPVYETKPAGVLSREEKLARLEAMALEGRKIEQERKRLVQDTKKDEPEQIKALEDDEQLDFIQSINKQKFLEKTRR